MSEWKPIGTAPKTGEMILAFYPALNCGISVKWEQKRRYPGWYIPGGSGVWVGATHWMKMPEPPQ